MLTTGDSSTVARFAFNIGQLHGALVSTLADPEAIDYFSDRQVHIEDLEGLHRAVRKIVEAFYNQVE